MAGYVYREWERLDANVSGPGDYQDDNYWVIFTTIWHL